MDEAVKQEKVEKCALLLFYVDVSTDCHEANNEGCFHCDSDRCSKSSSEDRISFIGKNCVRCYFKLFFFSF